MLHYVVAVRRKIHRSIFFLYFWFYEHLCQINVSNFSSPHSLELTAIQNEYLFGVYWIWIWGQHFWLGNWAELYVIVMVNTTNRTRRIKRKPKENQKHFKSTSNLSWIINCSIAVIRLPMVMVPFSYHFVSFHIENYPKIIFLPFFSRSNFTFYLIQLIFSTMYIVHCTLYSL